MAVKRDIERFSIAASILTFLFLLFVNGLSSEYPWVLFCLPPLIMWPYTVHRPSSMGNLRNAFFVCGAIVLYYVFINAFVFTGHPWALYVGFALIFYPCSLYYARKGGPFSFSMFGLLWCVLFFSVVNFITTPDTLWAIFPIFAVSWWPLSCYFFVYRNA